MLKDPQVGDVVYLEVPGPHNWLQPDSMISLTERWQITSFPVPTSGHDIHHLSGDQWQTPVRLRNFRSGMPMQNYQDANGVWTKWLIRDEFLTAVYNATHPGEYAAKS